MIRPSQLLGFALVLGSAATVYQEYSRRPVFAYPSRHLAEDAAKLLWHDQIPAGIATLRQAVHGDSGNPFRWCDLADALAQSGDSAGAVQAFSEALRRNPSSPQIALRAANFHFGAGNTKEALRLCARVLARVSDLDEPVFSLYLRFGGNTATVVREGIGDNPRAAGAYLSHVSARGLHEEASRLYAILQPRDWIPPETSLRFADALHRNRRFEEASEVLARATPGFRQSDWIYNGDFESGPLGRSFDWIAAPSDNLAVDLDNGVAERGGTSLRLRFRSAPDAEFHPLSQQTVLPPGRYEIGARVRIAGLAVREGLRLHVADIADPSRLDLWTGALSGPAEWTALTASFRIAPGSPRRLNIEFVRLASRGFDHKLEGTVWIDSVRLTRAPS